MRQALPFHPHPPHLLPTTIAELPFVVLVAVVLVAPAVIFVIVIAHWRPHSPHLLPHQSQSLRSH